MKILILITAILAIVNGLEPKQGERPNTKQNACSVEISQPQQKNKPLSLFDVIDSCSNYYKIPKEVIIGVAVSETRIGTTGIGTPEKSNNLFGIRAAKYDKHPKDMIYVCPSGKWRKYKTPQESVVDFCKFIQQHYHWFFSKPRTSDKWLLYGYGNKKYEKVGYFLQFKNYKM